MDFDSFSSKIAQDHGCMDIRSSIVSVSEVPHASESDKFDVMLCDAINTEVQRIDKYIRNKTAAGSTYCGLFLRRQEDGLVRAFCANVGDSRCLMVSVDEQFIQSATDAKDSEIDLNDSTHHSSIWGPQQILNRHHRSSTPSSTG